MAKYIKIGTCKHCGRQNTSLTMGLCKKHILNYMKMVNF